MTNLTGPAQAFHANTSVVDTSLKATLGQRSRDTNDNEFIYLQGIDSTVAGDWVVYDENFATTRLVPDEVGPVAIAMAAINAVTSYGWYQIYGKNTIARTDTISADKSLYIDGTVGRVDDLGVSGDLVIGAYSMTADTANIATVYISYPNISDDLGGGTVDFIDAEIPTGAINDANDIFTLSQTPSPAASLIFVVNGQVLSGIGVDYTLVTNTVTVNSPPPTGSIIRAWFRF